jgi:sulfate adenylyltransferase subunit 2
VMLYSIGKDSSVMLHLAIKAFHPARLPFPLLHVDTTWKFREMIAFRDQTARRLGIDLLVHINQDGLARGIGPVASGSSVHTRVMKTEALKQALDLYGFDAPLAAPGETKRRAGPRNAFSPSARRVMSGIRATSVPNCGTCSIPGFERARAFGCFRYRTGPNWTSGTISRWKVLPWCRFTSPNNARWCSATAHGSWWMMIACRWRLGEQPQMRLVRFRTLGCYPLTGAIESSAATLEDIVSEMRSTRVSERQGRLIDNDEAASMEKKKREGYF